MLLPVSNQLENSRNSGKHIVDWNGHHADEENFTKKMKNVMDINYW